MKEFEIVRISVSRSIRPSARNGYGRYLIDFGGIFKYISGCSRIGSCREYIPEEIQLVCLLCSGDGCIIRELCSGRSDIDVISIPEDIRIFSGEGYGIISFHPCFYDVTKSPVIIGSGRVLVGSALFLGSIMVTRMLDGPDTVEYPKVVGIIEGLEGWTIGS